MFHACVVLSVPFLRMMPAVLGLLLWRVAFLVVIMFDQVLPPAQRVCHVVVLQTVLFEHGPLGPL